MIVEVADRMSLGHAPIRLPAAQVLVRDDVGNPIMVAGEFGPTGSYRVSHVGDSDFQRVLKMFGYQEGRLNVEEVDTSHLKQG